MTVVPVQAGTQGTRGVVLQSPDSRLRRNDGGLRGKDGMARDAAHRFLVQWMQSTSQIHGGWNQ